MLKEDISSTACELTMFQLLTLSISVTFNVNCWTVESYEIVPATLANTFLIILQGSALSDVGSGGRS